MRIYVASSWRNEHQPYAVQQLRALGHEVYDFKDADGFQWEMCGPRRSEIVPVEDWDFGSWQQALKHKAAERGFARDMAALACAQRCVMVLPCGRSAHLEAGYAIGYGKPTAIFCPEYDTPDLMVKMADLVTDDWSEIVEWLGRPS